MAKSTFSGPEQTNRVIFTIKTPYPDKQFSYEKFIESLTEKIKETSNVLVKHKLLDYEDHLVHLNEALGGGMNTDIFKSIYLQFENELFKYLIEDMVIKTSIEDRSFEYKSYSIPNKEY